MSFLTHLIQHFRSVVLVQPQPVDTNKRVAGRDKANALLLKLRSRFRDRWLMTLKFLLSLIQISLWIWWKIFHVFANILFRRLRYCLSLSQSLSQFSQVDVSVVPPYWSVKRQTAKLVLWQEEMRGGFHRSNRINEARFTVRGVSKMRVSRAKEYLLTSRCRWVSAHNCDCLRSRTSWDRSWDRSIFIYLGNFEGLLRTIIDCLTSRTKEGYIYFCTASRDTCHL